MGKKAIKKCVRTILERSLEIACMPGRMSDGYHTYWTLSIL